MILMQTAGCLLYDCMVFDDDHRAMNQAGLRFDNEPARHKGLDAIGDLALLGRPIRAHYHGHCAGHSLNHALNLALMNQLALVT